MVVYLHEALDRKLAEGSALQRADIEQAAIEGAVQRLRPKLMTVAAVLASLAIGCRLSTIHSCQRL
jgi:Cu(I)/Ag(I) efflux system membrane protein CusA/SilA